MLKNRFTRDYASIYADLGRGEFIGRYQMMPVFVGQRVQSVAMDPGRGAFETFSLVPAIDVELLSPESFLNRVWFLERANKKGANRDIVVGRWSDHDVAIPDYSISRTHCTLEVSSQGYRIVDAGSRNGTVVDGNHLSKGEAAMLVGGETVVLGRFEFLFLTGRQFLDLLKDELSKL